jgi:hypothetical protein
MIKSIMLLCALSWVTFSHAYVAKENLAEAETFKVAAPEKDHAPQGRAVAGGKFKKKATTEKSAREPSPADDQESEKVKYWQYQE